MRNTICLILLFFSFWAQAQIAYVYCEKDSILVGDQVDFKLVLAGFSPNDIQEIRWDTLERLEFLNMADTSYYPVDFEMDATNFKGDDFNYDKPEMDWSIDDQSSPQEIYNTFKLTFWEMCAFKIPQPTIIMTNGDSLEASSGFLKVYSPKYDELAMEKAPSIGLIKESKRFYDYLLDFWWLIALVLGIIIALFIRRKLKNRKQKEIEIIPPPVPKRDIVVIPADVIALKKLKELKESRKWETESEKQYVSELTEIIREYIENRFDIKALEMTSTEILQSMEGDLLNNLQMEQLSNTLNVADMIKFAKSKVDMSLHEKFVDDAIDMVESSKEIIETEDE
jgi:hypothetical protein